MLKTIKNNMRKNLTVSVYFRHHEINPSNYYRFYQYIKDLPGKYYIHDTAPSYLYKRSLDSRSKFIKKIVQGIIFLVLSYRLFCCLVFDYFRKCDIIFIQRELSPRCILGINFLLFKMISKKTCIIWDFDDDIINDGEISKHELTIVEKKAKYILVISEYLKELLPCEYQSKVILLPTTDGDIYKKIDEKIIQDRIERFKTEVVLVWIGTSGNLKNLDYIIPALDSAAELLKNNNKKLFLYCVSGIEYQFETKYLIIKNVKWSRDNMIHTLMMSHIGIMPLPHNRFSLGKGGFKLIQYLSAGLPVIASDLGFNRNVVTGSKGILVDDIDSNLKWREAVLILSGFNYRILSEDAFETYKRKFNYKCNLNVLQQIILSMRDM